MNYTPRRNKSAPATRRLVHNNQNQPLKDRKKTQLDSSKDERHHIYQPSMNFQDSKTSFHRMRVKLSSMNSQQENKDERDPLDDDTISPDDKINIDSDHDNIDTRNESKLKRLSISSASSQPESDSAKKDNTHLFLLMGYSTSSVLFFTGYFCMLQPYNRSFPRYLSHASNMIKLSAELVLICVILITLLCLIEYKKLSTQKSNPNIAQYLNDSEKKNVTLKIKRYYETMLLGLGMTLLAECFLMSNIFMPGFAQWLTPLIFSLSFTVFIFNAALSTHSKTDKFITSILFFTQLIGGILLTIHSFHIAPTCIATIHTWSCDIMPIILMFSMISASLILLKPLYYLKNGKSILYNEKSQNQPNKRRQQTQHIHPNKLASIIEHHNEDKKRSPVSLKLHNNKKSNMIKSKLTSKLSQPIEYGDNTPQTRPLGRHMLQHTSRDNDSLNENDTISQKCSDETTDTQYSYLDVFVTQDNNQKNEEQKDESPTYQN
jgi:hypothetical protein